MLERPYPLPSDANRTANALKASDTSAPPSSPESRPDVAPSLSELSASSRALLERLASPGPNGPAGPGAPYFPDPHNRTERKAREQLAAAGLITGTTVGIWPTAEGYAWLATERVLTPTIALSTPTRTPAPIVFGPADADADAESTERLLDAVANARGMHRDAVAHEALKIGLARMTDPTLPQSSAPTLRSAVVDGVAVVAWSDVCRVAEFSNVHTIAVTHAVKFEKRKGRLSKRRGPDGLLISVDELRRFVSSLDPDFYHHTRARLLGAMRELP